VRSYIVAKQPSEMHLPIYSPPYGICGYHEGMSVTVRVRLIFCHISEWVLPIFFIRIYLFADVDMTSVELLVLTCQCTVCVYIYIYICCMQYVMKLLTNVSRIESRIYLIAQVFAIPCYDGGNQVKLDLLRSIVALAANIYHK